MKLVLDEKLKHRLIGLAVIISLGAIFAPALMKKSGQRLDNNLSVNVKLPPKPIAPNVVLTDEKDLFKTIKIAKVRIPAVSEESQLTELVKAEPINSNIVAANQKQLATKADIDDKSSPIQLALNEAASTAAAKKLGKMGTNTVINHQKTIALKQKPVSKTSNPIKIATNGTSSTIAKNNSKAVIRKEVYAVQLASFSRLNNAQSLVNRLRAKGYKANYTKTASNRGAIYKVYAGNSPRKLEVVKLKAQLATAMQINGFVVNTGVS